MSFHDGMPEGSVPKGNRNFSPELNESGIRLANGEPLEYSRVYGTSSVDEVLERLGENKQHR